MQKNVTIYFLNYCTECIKKKIKFLTTDCKEAIWEIVVVLLFNNSKTLKITIFCWCVKTMRLEFLSFWNQQDKLNRKNRLRFVYSQFKSSDLSVDKTFFDFFNMLRAMKTCAMNAKSRIILKRSKCMVTWLIMG